MTLGIRKRTTDLEIISEWIEPGQRVLDLGCGRGILLEKLQQTKNIYGVGVDTDPAKVRSCVKRGVNVYHGDAENLMKEFPDGFFDWVVISRTVQELPKPADVLNESLRVGKHLAMGFVNYAYWKNRLAVIAGKIRVKNEVFPYEWEESSPHNPVSISGFEAYCDRAGFRRETTVYLHGDWKTHCNWLPNLRAGYAVYAIGK